MASTRKQNKSLTYVHIRSNGQRNFFLWVNKTSAAQRAMLAVLTEQRMSGPQQLRNLTWTRAVELAKEIDAKAMDFKKQAEERK